MRHRDAAADGSGIRRLTHKTVTAIARWGSAGLTDDRTHADAEHGRADGWPGVYLNGPLEAHNEWEHASHRQMAHPRTAATEHKK
jgi:hypothetical protein